MRLKGAVAAKWRELARLRGADEGLVVSRVRDEKMAAKVDKPFAVLRFVYG